MGNKNRASLITLIEESRLFKHPFFSDWASTQCSPEVFGALFHQIQCFCASTRPGLHFPQNLRIYGYEREAALIEEIVEGEEGHGRQLATMAAYLVNRAANRQLFTELEDQEGIEAGLKIYSDELLGHLPAYDRHTGLTREARDIIDIFRLRAKRDYQSTIYSLGVSFALEITSNRHIIPGEYRALVESRWYNVSLEDKPMEYLRSHLGDSGAEAMHGTNKMLFEQ